VAGPGPDPFGAERLRASVLRAWRDSPTRLTEDVNAEQDLVRGGYRDRLIVELAQNAADAAALARSPGRVRVVVADGELRIANTGAPLDAAGVAALSSLRASAKQGDSVGRFGVGFAAVLTVTDAPRVVSRTGGVAFSAERSRAAAERDDAPVLRLPWPLPPQEPPLPAGFDTEIRMPLRPDVDVAALLERISRDVPDLLLVLPWLAEFVIEDRRWQRRTEDDLVRLDLPSGERQRWLTHSCGQVVWALPVDEAGSPAPLPRDVLHAPTPTDERLSLPARLIATVPLEPSRRRVLADERVEEVLDSAAQAYPGLVARLAAEHRPALVPQPAFPLSDLDEKLRDRILRALARQAWLPAADGGQELPGGGATVLGVDVPGLVELVADLLPDLVAAPLAGSTVARALAPAGARTVTIADIVAAVTGIERPLTWWSSLYDLLLRGIDTHVVTADELAALPVPLLGGRTVPGPRGALLVDTRGDLLEVLAELDVGGLRLADPAVAHPLLERLGARRAGPADVLAAPELQAAIERSVPDVEAGLDVRPLVAAVLRLAAETGVSGLAGLALPARSGGWRRADELVLPDTAMVDVLDPDALGPDAPLDVLDPGFAREHDAAVLAGIGVLDSFVVIDDAAPAGPDHDLPDEDDWWYATTEPPERVLAVRDLDLVADDAWPAALTLLAAAPRTWQALTLPGGHTGWWIARYALIGGQAPADWRLPEADGLAGLYDPVPEVELRPELLRQVGVRDELVVDDAAHAADLLDRLGDADRDVPPGLAMRVHAALSQADLDCHDVDPPEQVRSLAGTVIPAGRAAVLDGPWLLAVCPAGTLVAAPVTTGDSSGVATLAELLDLPAASDRTAATVESAGEYVPWSQLSALRAAAELLDIPLPEGGVLVHEQLEVLVADTVRSVRWWSDRQLHAEDSAVGLARAFAWATDRWQQRHVLTALLDDPDPVTLLA
jgi:hypothetical protein